MNRTSNNILQEHSFGTGKTVVSLLAMQKYNNLMKKYTVSTSVTKNNLKHITNKSDTKP